MMATATPALASTTITSGGLPYSGAIVASNIGGNVTLSGSSPLGLVTSTCTNAQLNATVLSNGTGGQLTGVTLNNGAGPCTNNRGGTTTVTTQNLPYSGGTVTYAPVAGGRDGTLVIASPNAAVSVKAVLTLPTLGVPTQTCYYGLKTTTPAITIDLWNGTNANRPVTTNSHSQGRLTGQRLDLLTGSTSNCPTSASANGKFQIVTPGGADLVLGP
jgi:hypothetical protein